MFNFLLYARKFIMYAYLIFEPYLHTIFMSFTGIIHTKYNCGLFEERNVLTIPE